MKEGKENPNYRTGMRCKGVKTSLATSWDNMKQRCLNPNHPKFHRYGGRGIKIYEPWLISANFVNWAKSNGWQEGLTIDRIDNDGDYCPENCRWVSVSENSRRKSTSKLSNKDAAEIRKRRNENWYKLAEEFKCSHGCIWFIMNDFTHVPDGECTKKIKERR